MGFPITKGVIITIKQITFDFFKLCNLTPQEIRKGVWQVQIDESLMKELDGWRAQARLLQFTFDQHLAENYGADLICSGSYRLNTILEVIQKQGVVTHLHIPHNVFHEPNIRQKILDELGSENKIYVVNCSLLYEQYFQLKILAKTSGAQKKESIHTLNVNLSSGDVLKFAISEHLIKAGGVTGAEIRKRRCSFKQAFSNVIEYLIDAPQFANPQWTKEAWEIFYQEKEKLQNFLNENNNAEVQELKIKELRNRYAPKLQLDVLRGAILYSPIFLYKLILLKPLGQELSKTVYYDPISNRCELN